MKKIDEAQFLYKKLSDVLYARNVLIWEEAKLWYELKKDGLYKYVFGDSGERNPSKFWTSFVREVGVPKSTVEMRLRLYEFWVVKKRISIEKLRKINVRKLDRAISYIERGDVKLLEVILQAEVLPISEFLAWLNIKRSENNKEL